MENHGITPGSVLIRNTCINFLGMALPILVGIIAIPFAIQGLGKDGFGILTIAWVVVGYLGLMDFGLSRAATKFTAEHIRKGDALSISRILWASVLMGFCLGLAGGAAFRVAAPLLVQSLLNIDASYAEEAIRSFRFIGYALPFVLISTSLKGMLGAAQRFDLINSIQIPVNVLSFIFPALSLVFGYGLSAVILLILGTRIVSCTVYFGLCAKIFSFRLRRPCFDWVLLRRLFAYGGWVTVTGVVSPILVHIDRFFIGSMLSMTSLTFYAAPLEAVTRLRIFPVAIMTTLFPEFSKEYSGREQQRIRLLFGKSLKAILTVTGILSIVLFFYAPDILGLWLGPQFVEQSTTIFRIFSISILINFLAILPFTFLQGLGRPDVPAKFHFLELPIYIFLLWMFIRQFGLSGAAWAWLLRVALDAALLFGYASRVVEDFYGIIRESRIRNIVIVLCLFGGLVALMKHLALGPAFDFLSLLVCLFLTAGSVWRFALDSDEKNRIQSLTKKRHP